MTGSPSGNDARTPEEKPFLDPALWSDLRSSLAGTSVNADALWAALNEQLEALHHGDLGKWLDSLDHMPKTTPGWDGSMAMPHLGTELKDPHDQSAMRQALQGLHPWRKGPLALGGIPIDTEWRSDWKWDRIKGALELRGKTVLDVGSGNGYFGWRMLAEGARCVVGIDPTVLFIMQWLAQRQCAGPAANFVLPLRDTDLPPDLGHFDVVMSMGVLYHRRDPADHLNRLYQCLAPGGQLLLETLVVDGDDTLYPSGRYARMRNVHEVPALERLRNHLVSAGFQDLVVVDCTVTSLEEQRSTDWMRFESLSECLDPQDPTRTIEGHPAPLRAVLSATRR